MKLTAREMVNWSVNSQHKDGWRPARPINHRYESLLERARLAWGVLMGRYDVLDWEDGEDG